MTALKDPPQPEPEVLIEQARRRQRRRRCAIAAVVVLVLASAGLVVLLVSGGAHGSNRASRVVGTVPPAGAGANLRLAGALAVGPDDALYVADVADSRAGFGAASADRVLVRGPDGHFRVVASDLPYISDLAFAPDGTLYVADAGRVQTVGPNGTVRTIAGDGRAEPRNPKTRAPLKVPAGTGAFTAALGSIQSVRDHRDGPLHITFGPGGQLYIATDAQILRLTPQGTLDPVRATVAPTHGVIGGQLNEVGALAVARHGTIYAGSLTRGWTLWAVKPNGTASYLAYARQSGGNTVAVQRGPNGTIYTEDGDTVQAIENGKPKTVFEFARKINNEPFELTNFAIGPNGTIYADEVPGNNGFEAHQQLVAVHGQKTTLLWQERNRAPR